MIRKKGENLCSSERFFINSLVFSKPPPNINIDIVRKSFFNMETLSVKAPIEIYHIR